MPDRRRGAVALGLACAPAVSNSFARFAYALVLPSMQADLGWTYAQAGWANTANTIGYLVGALLTLALVSRTGNRALFLGGLAGTSVSVFACGFTADFGALLAWRFSGGLFSAMIFVCGGVLAGHIHRDAPERSAVDIAVFFAGAGVGMALSGLALPPLLALLGDAGWPWAWRVLGAASAVAAVISARAAMHIEETPPSGIRVDWPLSAYVPALAGYFLNALGYIAYMTFIAAWIAARQGPPGSVVILWTALGLAAAVAPVLWRRALSRWRGGLALAACTLCVAVGTVLPVFSVSTPVLVLSGIAFGNGLFIAPAAVAGLVKRSLPASAWGPALATFTATFAIGQGIGPALAGLVADAAGSLQPALLASAAVLAAAAAVALVQREPGRRPNETSSTG